MRDKTGVKVTANARHAADGIADAVGIKAADQEGAARQPDLIPLLRTQFFIVMGLVDAIPMIAVGLGLYVMFAVA